jgi:6-phosphogluconolactonase
MTDGRPEVVVLPTPADAAQLAATRIAAALIAAVEARGVAHWVTTGGSTPGAIYSHLAGMPFRESVPWDRVHLWWGDERWIPPDNVLSNALSCWNILLDEVPVPRDQVHVMPIGEAMAAGEGPEIVAARYAEMLRAADLELDPTGFPRLDIVLMGVGSDGHLFSVFPDSATWDDPRWVQAVPAPEHIAPHIERVTLHPRIVAAARMPMAVVFGAAKAAILGEIFGPARDERRLPAQLALRPGALWVVDEAAAADIDRSGAGGPRSIAGPTADGGPRPRAAESR